MEKYGMLAVFAFISCLISWRFFPTVLQRFCWTLCIDEVNEIIQRVIILDIVQMRCKVSNHQVELSPYMATFCETICEDWPFLQKTSQTLLLSVFLDPRVLISACALKSCLLFNYHLLLWWKPSYMFCFIPVLMDYHHHKMLKKSFSLSKFFLMNIYMMAIMRY